MPTLLSYTVILQKQNVSRNKVVGPTVQSTKAETDFLKECGLVKQLGMQDR